MLAFEILMQLEKVLSKEEFASLSLPINVSQLTLRRDDGRHLGSMDEVKDGDVIYVTAKNSTDDEKEEGFPNYNILKKVTRHPKMETALDQLRIFDEVSSPSSTIAIRGASPISNEARHEIHIDLDLSDIEEPTQQREDSNAFPQSEISFLSENKFHLKNDENAKIQDVLEENNRLQQEVLALKKRLERESKNTASALAANKKLKSQKRLLLEEIRRVEQTVKSMSKYKSKLEQQLQFLEQKCEKQMKGCSNFTGIDLPKKAPERPAELENAIKSLQKIIDNLRGKLIEEYKSQIVCSICFEHPRDKVLIPCGHCFCGKCADRFETCPHCRKKVKHLQKIY
jgi:hypothetical protein